MKTIMNKLRIGEQMALGFSLVGLIFVSVIWQYHSTLKQSLIDYQYLNDIYAQKKQLVLNIELGLLKARQSEKDFLIYRELKNSKLVVTQIQHNLEQVQLLSKIDLAAKKSATQFEKNLQQYLEHFHLVENAWVKKGLDENSGLQGSFRDAVHALEKMVSQLNNDKLYVNLLQLRRHEKDYLLRSDQRYVEQALVTIQTIHKQLQQTPFIADEKARFTTLLKNYEGDFIALVEQNKHISRVVATLEKVAAKVSQLVKKNVINHNLAVIEKTKQINSSTSEQVIIMLWLVAVALLLGIYFSFSISKRIVLPLRKMAILLENLTFTEQTEKMPFQEGGRNEINAMSGSLNILADHRKRFIDWWKNSMDESESCEQLEKLLKHLSEKDPSFAPEFKKIKAEIIEVQAEKKLILSREYHQIKEYNQDIIKQSTLIGHASIPRDEMDKAANVIHYNANLIKNILDMLSYKTH